MQSLSLNARPESLLSFQWRNPLPVVLQTEASECGLACVAMIAGYYGHKIDLTSLRQRFSISAQGATLKQLMDIATQMALSCRALRLELEQLHELKTPCVLHWEMKHFVVLRSVSKDKLVIHDPALGERDIPMHQADKLFTGIALELTPTSDFQAKDERQRLTLSHFWSRIVGLGRNLAVIFALSLLLQLFAIVSPYFMQLVVDDVLLRSDANLLTVLALGFALLLLIDTGTSMLRQQVILRLSSSLNMQMSANVFHRLIRLPLEYFKKRHMGDVVSRFGSLHAIRELFTTGLVAAVLDGVMAVLTLAVMLVYDVQLSLIVIAVVIVYAALRLALYRPLRLLNEESIVASARENSHFMESVRALQTIKLFSKETERESQWQNRLADAMNKDIRINRWNINIGGINQLLFGVENILVIYFAASAVMADTLSIGMLYAFMSYKARFISASDGLINKWLEFKMLDLHFDRLADMVFTEEDKLVSPPQCGYGMGDSQQTHRLKGELEVKGLQYRYSGTDNLVLKDINLKVNAGDTLAIVGASGCGKSTLLQCLMGLVTPTAGTILVDGEPLQRLPDYRHQIAAVMQDDQLLSGSIAENIACFDQQPDMQRVIIAAQLACIHDDITGLAMQYNTLVGDMGASLSGGQKQRIMLARALYREPVILFMDEATSHLDTRNESQINEYVSHLPITRIIIAHRPETIRMAKRVMLLSDGELTDVTGQFHQHSQNPNDPPTLETSHGHHHHN